MPAGAPESPSVATRSSLYRRVGSRVLRFFRPAVAPFLARLEMRIEAALRKELDEREERAALRLRSAVETVFDEREERAASVFREREERAAVRLRSIVETVFSERDEQISRFQATMTEGLHKIMEQLKEGDKFVRSADESASTALVALQCLQIGVDAIRLDIIATKDRQIERVEAPSPPSRHDRLYGAEALVLAGQIESLLALVHDTVQRILSSVETQLHRVVIPLGENALVRTSEGFLVAPAEDLATLAVLHEGGGRVDPGTVAVIQALLRAGDVYVDVGANIGLTVLPAARAVGSSGKVIAIEPGTRARQVLQQTLILNGLTSRVILHGFAAGAEEGSATLKITSIYGHSSLVDLPNVHHVEQVEVRAIDDLVDPGQTIRLVKIDVEGLEILVWRGMRRILADNPALVVVIEFGPEHLERANITIDAWLAEFSDLGFVAYEIDRESGQLRHLRSHDELAKVISLDLLLSRQTLASYPNLALA